MTTARTCLNYITRKQRCVYCRICYTTQRFRVGFAADFVYVVGNDDADTDDADTNDDADNDDRDIGNDDGDNDDRDTNKPQTV